MTAKKRHKDIPRSNAATIRVGVDTGGTFTDFVFASGTSFEIFKVPSTPSDPSDAIAAGLNIVQQRTGVRLANLEVVHGTTVGTNALLQRKGARTALITTSGFEDVLEIGRQARTELYNLNAVKPLPLCPGELRFGVRERITATGEVLKELDQRELARLPGRLRKAKAESIAICLLFSFVDPRHEQRIAEELAVLGIPLSVSHVVLPEYREFERTSTVTINAYLQPLMGSYLQRLSQRAAGLRVMQSSGGSISASGAAAEPVRTILSGPAGGVVGALDTAQSAGFPNIITFDMGGTSTDVALCDHGKLRMTNEAVVAGLPVAISMMDIHTVGAGGGSIARVDEGGSLRVGPESAGADPGPACYGRSFLPTVTDAHVVLGHFGGTGLLGGKFTLDESRSRQALAALAQEMSRAANRRISMIQAADGVVAVVNTNMERALRSISIERGYDSRGFALLPFGGAGGLHAVDLARALRIPEIIVPTSAGALSAIGVLTADVVKDQSRTLMIGFDAAANRKIEKAFREMEQLATQALLIEGFSNARQRHERFLAVRYQGQSFELEIPFTNTAVENFHQAHLQRYGYSQESSVIEVVSARLRSSGLVERLQRRCMRKSATKTAKANRFVDAYFGARKTLTAVYERRDLNAGERLKAPCIVVEYSSTTLVPAGTDAVVDGFGNLILKVSDDS